MLIVRHAEKTLEKLRRTFPAVALVGARQTGKTSLLRHVQGKADYRSFNDYILLDATKQDAPGFARDLKTPVILDEAQYASEILRALTPRIDAEKKMGAFLMASSQQFELMESLGESMEGRVGLLALPGLTTREIFGDAFDAPFMPDENFLAQKTSIALNAQTLWRRIHRGSMPQLHTDADIPTQDYFSAYIKTYIERDVRSLTQVDDEMAFMAFITACAMRTGSLLNLSEISREVGVSVPTAKRWFAILQTSGLVWLLRPYSRNIPVRTIKTPKIYFADTGLAAYLSRWQTPDTLQHGSMRSAMFKTYVIGEIIKSYLNAGMEAPIYYYRDAVGREIDLLFEKDGELFPIEIKMSSSPRDKDMRHFKYVRRVLGESARPGAVICMYSETLKIGDGLALPVGLL